LTGTGVPHPTPGRAGPGALVRHGDIALQFDAGRGTVMRLADAGTSPAFLTALFLTHVHSDHLVDLADVTMTRWLQQQIHRTGPLHIVATEGEAAYFVEHMLDIWAHDISLRTGHVGAPPPEFVLHTFAAPTAPTEIWRSADGTVVVEAVAVHHEPVADAVAYRVVTPAGVVVISGDTRVCAEVQALSVGADVLVHEACRKTAMADAIRGTVFETIFSYHADSVPLGGLAAGAQVQHLVLTHMIPSPATPAEEQSFVDDVRAGGYVGTVTVGRDLDTFEITPEGVRLVRP
ncbi:MAG: MBL fold metallo-hydrolase, partial [Ilumatobacteraceae bacterium]